MKDIRQELQQRIAKYQAERDGIKKRLTLLDQLERMTRDLLMEEERSMESRQTNLFLRTNGKYEYKLKLGELILSFLSESISIHLDQLVREVEAKKFSFEGKSPARSVNAALLGLMSGKKIERAGKNLWRLKQTPPQEEL